MFFLSVLLFFFNYFFLSLALLAIAQCFVDYKLILFVCKHTNSDFPDTVYCLILYNFISFPLFLYEDLNSRNSSEYIIRFTH